MPVQIFSVDFLQIKMVLRRHKVSYRTKHVSYFDRAGFIFHSERAEMSNTDLSCILGCSVCAVTDFLVKLSLVMDD